MSMAREKRLYVLANKVYHLLTVDGLSREDRRFILGVVAARIRLIDTHKGGSGRPGLPARALDPDEIGENNMLYGQD